MRWWKLSLVLVALLAVGCGNDNDEPQIELAPLGVYSTVPVDAQPSPWTGLVGVEVNFNRGATQGELRSWFLPPTLGATFVPKSSSGRSWTFDNLRLYEDQKYYFWVIDGVHLGRWVNLANDRVFVRTPVLVRVPSSLDRQYGVGFRGTVESTNPRIIASGTMIFALPPDSGFNPLEPESTFDPQTAIGLAVASRNDDFVEMDAPYRATFLPLDELFLVVAVKDTNNDLHYSPADDWWGMHEVDSEFTAVYAREDTGEKDSLFNSGVNIVLRPPVTP